ncbi:MAG: AIPR family protein [Vicinamibacterales bacterium]
MWDIGRLHRFAGSGGREEIVVDLEADFGGGLPVLPAHLSDAGYQAFLAVVPGSQLAAVYERWGARLLEQNVRVFLQARGSVNKGIRNTIENDPEMFFAYNNGITATAEGVETSRDSGGLVVRSVRNLQIVNGGQTTASIHAASRKKDVDLSKVFVQMKLSIIEPSRALDVVPRISEFANSQNRVNAADFFANHPFHVRFEEFSRRVFAPSPDGSFRESKWFYERARGQYQDARTLLNAAQRKKFDLEYPKMQLVEKTDLAKFLNSWRGHPDIVSKGSQKNFAEFARHIGAEWSKDSDAFNEHFYRQSIARRSSFTEPRSWSPSSRGIKAAASDRESFHTPSPSWLTTRPSGDASLTSKPCGVCRAYRTA